MSFYKKTVTETLHEIDSSRDGLTNREAARRLKKFGLNAIELKHSSLFKKIIEPFASLMMGVLALAGILSIYHHEYIDAAIVFAMMTTSAVIDWVQQYSTARILRALKQRETDPAEVLRDGSVTDVDPEKLVVGDVIVMHEGQKIPADARVIEDDNLQVDESVLTGESLVVHKSDDTFSAHDDKEIYEQTNMLFSGSFVATGSGVAVVVATGNQTEFGSIAKLAQPSSDNKSSLQRKVDKMMRYVIIAVFGVVAIAFLIELARGVNLVDALKFVLAMAVSAVPESLPVAITVVAVFGMRRMAKKKALVRSMRAIENLGLVTTIATDKTGTLTENKLRVQMVWAPNLRLSSFLSVVRRSLNRVAGQNADPLDGALENYINEQPAQAGATTDNDLVENLPFDYEFAMSGNIWRCRQNLELCIKGAPEKILSSCRVSPEIKRLADAKLHTFAREGYRVIAFAKMSLEHSFDDFSRFPRNEKAVFIGFAAIADNLRVGVDHAVLDAQRAGIEVRMITGDHLETAVSIARQAGIADSENEAVDAHQLNSADTSEFSERVEAAKVFARVLPETKYSIVTELNKGNVTAMTGDGVNDVPALTRANVGVAMGSGAAIAKDAADMVLLDNNFKSIVSAVREGRIIFSNIRRMMVYLIATNAGEVLTTLGALILGLPLPLLAVQILWINLATDTFMTLPLGLEAGAPDIMRQPPNKTNAPLLTGYLLSRVIVVAVAMAVITLGVYVIFWRWHGVEVARGAAFLTLIAIQWVDAFVLRGEESFAKLFTHKNTAFMLAFIGTFILQTIMLITPLSRVMQVTAVHADAWIACLIGAIVMLTVVEIHKSIGRRVAHNERDD
ncbi:MAG: cation-transporting P-type ATPase [Candidatus Nanoperiomorbaceae bacterium]